MSGPLAGMRVIELAGIGPAPMCAMLLADLGATVLRIDRPSPPERGVAQPLGTQVLLRNRQTLLLDLKVPAARDLMLRLVGDADALVEGFRPGVMERLGIGPQECLVRNRRLVYGRVTGWGQDGPLAQAAGHDLNYIALAGALHGIGRADGPPSVPLNLIGDFGGGALYLAFGVLAAILHARQTGRGQVVDAAMVDGVASLLGMAYGMRAAGVTTDARGTNLLDGGAYFYDTYQCADGEWIAIAALERRFHDELLQRIGLDAADFPAQSDRARWPEARSQLAALFATRTRAAWCKVLEGTDACFAPVLSLSEAAEHPHLRARGTHLTIDGVLQPAPAPRFSATPPDAPRAPQPPDADAALAGWLPAMEISMLRASGMIA